MNNYLYKQKLKVLNKRIGILMIICLFTISFTVIANINSGFEMFLDIFNYTLEKDLLFIPFGMFIMCMSLDYRNVYRIRFNNKFHWFKKEIIFLLKIVLYYLIIYMSVAILTYIISCIFLKYVIKINFYNIIFLVLIFIRRFIFLLLILMGGLFIDILFKIKPSISIFIMYLVLEIIQILEMSFLNLPIIRPIIYIKQSIIKNIIYILPISFIAILIMLFLYVLIGEKYEI